jgi:hypothetical protein
MGACEATRSSCADRLAGAGTAHPVTRRPLWCLSGSGAPVPGAPVPAGRAAEVARSPGAGVRRAGGTDSARRSNLVDVATTVPVSMRGELVRHRPSRPPPALRTPAGPTRRPRRAGRRTPRRLVVAPGRRPGLPPPCGSACEPTSWWILAHPVRTRSRPSRRGCCRSRSRPCEAWTSPPPGCAVGARRVVAGIDVLEVQLVAEDQPAAEHRAGRTPARRCRPLSERPSPSPPGRTTCRHLPCWVTDL